MNLSARKVFTGILAILIPTLAATVLAQRETALEHDARMQWWREARFGLFIHWGLYAIPAGEWQGATNHAEWIRTTAQIPLAQYDKFVGQFNPVKFNAEDWVRTAKAAGAKYIVITSKHHDGFCLFQSAHSDFDVASTPFKRDILKELADACHRQGLQICWYYSIMDWHHPDYLPRRDWEKDRPVQGADFARYITYMKSELRELLTNYGKIGVLWFDGEWESTWNQAYGRDLYTYVRSLQPEILVNNRVGAGRSGMEGLTKEGEFGGDFGTPEQQIPATGLPGTDWESCMTMNDHWGYNSHDNNWKSTRTLIRMLADTASKGGNLLLNVGPTSEGLFPQPSVDRLREIGQWMNVNSEAIYGTQASQFKKLDWGRCTTKSISGGTRLYLHVFDWPQDGRLTVPGIFNEPKQAYMLSDSGRSALAVARKEDALVISVPAAAPDPNDSVVVLDVAGRPDINDPPVIDSDFRIFVDSLDISIHSEREGVDVRYTLDGSAPTASSRVVSGKITLRETASVSARCFRGGNPVSPTVLALFRKVDPLPAVQSGALQNGINYAYFEGNWDRLPDFKTINPQKRGSLPEPGLSPQSRPEYFGFEFTGFIRIPATDVYNFYTESDDGSALYIGDSLVVDNNGLHGAQEKKGEIALAAGMHPIRIEYFNKTGGSGLKVSYAGKNVKKQLLPPTLLFRRRS